MRCLQPLIPWELSWTLGAQSSGLQPSFLQPGGGGGLLGPKVGGVCLELLHLKRLYGTFLLHGLQGSSSRGLHESDVFVLRSSGLL